MVYLFFVQVYIFSLIKLKVNKFVINAMVHSNLKKKIERKTIYRYLVLSMQKDHAIAPKH